MSIAVTIKYDPEWRPLYWAKKHCRSYITNDAVKVEDVVEHNIYDVRYYFSDPRDAVVFTLRWT
jgi:hypothetical protein